MSDTRVAFAHFIALAVHRIDEAVARAKADPGLLHLRSGLDETPLHYLVVENQLNPVARLIRAGASVDVVNFCGSSPLLEAAMLGYVPMCKLLLEHGANPSVANNVDATPLSVAALRNHDELFTLLLPFCSRDINEYFSELDASELQRRTDHPIQRQCQHLGLRAGYENEESAD
jgi:ankyrin repeat protein